MREAPALKASLFLSLGVAVGYWFPIHPLYLLGALTIVLAVYFLPIFRLFSNYGIALLLVLTGSFAYSSSLPPEPHSSIFLTVQGIVSEPPIARDKRVSFPLQLTELKKADGSSVQASGSLWVVGELDTLPELGWELAITGLLEKFPEQRNPGQFDLRRYRRADGMIGRLKFTYSGDIHIVSREISTILKTRSSLDSICDSLGRWDAPLWKGLLLGFRRDLDAELVEELRVTGLTHLLALSGLNIGFLAIALLGILAIFPLSPSQRAIPALLIVIFYTLLIPDRGATVRAALMVSTLLLGRIFHRWASPLNSIGLAALLALIYRPGDLFDAGFQMSFAATTAIILFNPEITGLQQGIGRRSKTSRLCMHWLVTPFLISIVSSIAVAPLTAYHFFGVPLAGPFYNLWAVPIMGLIYAGAWTSVFLYPLHTGIAQLVADGVLALGFWWREFVSFSAEHAPIWEGFLPPLGILLMFLTLIWIAFSKRTHPARFTLGVLALSLIAILGSLPIYLSSPQIWILDVGHGDASILQFPGGGTSVIDGGPENSEQGQGVLHAALRRLNTARISLLVASHLEADHIGGLPEVIDAFPVELAVIGGGNPENELPKRFFSVIKENAIPVALPPTSGMAITGFPTNVSLKILSRPSQLEKTSPNNSSIPLMLSLNRPNGHILSFLTCGDLEAEGERRLAGRENIRAQLLKASHHGSASSSTQEFLAAVKPDDVIITRSSLNERGSPAVRRSVLNRLREGGIRVHRVDREGALLFEATDNGWRRIDWRYPPLQLWILGRMS